MYPMLPVFLYCPLLTAPSVFSNVQLAKTELSNSAIDSDDNHSYYLVNTSLYLTKLHL